MRLNRRLWRDSLLSDKSLGFGSFNAERAIATVANILLNCSCLQIEFCAEIGCEDRYKPVLTLCAANVTSPSIKHFVGLRSH